MLMRRREALSAVAGFGFAACTTARRLVSFGDGRVYRWVGIRFAGDKSRAVVIELSERAQIHSKNLSRLVDERYFDGIDVHRVVEGRFVQTGDPSSRKENSTKAIGTGGPGYTLPPEFGLRHVRGAVGMSRLSDGVNPGQRSNGSQFFFVLKDSPELDDRNTVFGMVVHGLEVLDEISSTPVNGQGQPLTRHRIERTNGSTVSAQDALRGL